MATGARALHFRVIHIHRQERDIAMAGAALLTGGNMVQRLACGADAVMAGNTVVAHLVMIETRRLPAEIGVAVRALVVHRNMSGRFAGHGDVVVAIFAAAEDFVVIDDWHRLPSNGAVAGVATLTGKDVIDRFGGGVEAAVDAVAGHTFRRGTGELPVYVAAFARNKIVTAGEFKSGSGVIERLVLGQRSSGITQKHRQTEHPQTPLHCSHHGSSPAISTGKTCSGYGSGRNFCRNRHCECPGAHDMYHRRPRSCADQFLEHDRHHRQAPGVSPTEGSQ